MPRKDRMNKRCNQVKTKSNNVYKVPQDKLEAVFFANQFQLTDPSRSYTGVKFAIAHDQTHTTPQVGKHIFSVELPITQKFLSLLEWYSGKDKIDLKTVTVVETGLNDREAKTHHFDLTDETMLRILINLRDDDNNGAVGLGITIKDKKGKEIRTWMSTKSAYATILPGCLSELTIMSGSGDIPTFRETNSRSVFVIMDIVPLKDTQYNTADNIMEQTNVKKEDLINQVKQLQKEGKIPLDKLQEMMKDPEAALRKLTEDDPDAELDSLVGAPAAESSEAGKEDIPPQEEQAKQQLSKKKMKALRLQEQIKANQERLLALKAQDQSRTATMDIVQQTAIQEAFDAQCVSCAEALQQTEGQQQKLVDVVVG